MIIPLRIESLGIREKKPAIGQAAFEAFVIAFIATESHTMNKSCGLKWCML